MARTEMPAPHGAGHANRGATSPAYADQVVEATAGGVTARGLSLPEWTDSVDDAIAEADQQLVAMHGSSNWDRSVQALERYRQSVEQEMNEWEL